MDNSTIQKKRGGRFVKVTAAQQQQQSSDASSSTASAVDNTDNISKCVESAYTIGSSEKQQSPNASVVDVDGSAISISPTTDSASAIAVGECRRSSRKKIIKFDVRDLLNKNRKPHKIQIEARIDSNAPASSTLSAGPGSSLSVSTGGGSAASATAASVADLTSKQKTFIEKSAIFRRYSISEQQNKINAPPPRPPLPPPVSKLSLLTKNVDASASDVGVDINLSAQIQIPMDPIKMAQARRLSRTQEIFNASMMKSKQNSSLIVAQMESSSSNCGNVITSSNVSPLVQRRNAIAMSGVKRKIVGAKQSPSTNAPVKKNIPEHFSTQDSKTQKRRGRPPKNRTMETDQLPKNTELLEAKKSISSETSTVKLTPEKATNWKEYKECLKAKEKRSQIGVVATEPKKPTTSVQETSDVVLEISSSDSELEELHSATSESSSSNKEANQSPRQRSFAAVSFIQETPSVSDNKSAAPEFIVAAVEEILTESPADVVDNYENPPLSTETKSAENSELVSISACTTDLITENAPVIPTMEKKLPIRTSSGSESETNSDRSNKSYKLRVSVKRLSAQELSPNKDKTQIVPSSPTNSISSCSSSTRNSFSENSATSSKDTAEVQVKQTKKRSKRLQMKSEQMSVTSTSTASEAENEEKTAKNKDDSLPAIGKRTRKQTKAKHFSKEALIVGASIVQTKDVPLLQKENEATKSEDKDKDTTENIPEQTMSISSKNLNEKQTETPTENNTAINEADQDIPDGRSVVTESKSLLEESNITLLQVISEEVTENTDEINKSIDTTVKEKTKIELPTTADTGESVNVETGKTPKQLTKPIREPANEAFFEETELASNSTTETNTEIVFETSQTKEKSKSPIKQQKQKILDNAKDERKILPITKEKKATTPPKKQKLKNIENASVDNTTVENTLEEETPTTSEKLETALEPEGTTVTVKEQNIIIPENNVNPPIALPITKQTHIEETHDATASKLGNISNITEQVSVDAKTLLDILKTVQTNEEAAAAAATTAEVTEKSSTITKISTGSKKRNSPARSDTSSPQELKKPIRRYERRSKRGEETTHKTLEETFAEIAAQSSKEILEMAAALGTQREDTAPEDDGLEKNKTVKETEAIKSDDLLRANDKSDAEDPIVELCETIFTNKNIELAESEEKCTDSQERNENTEESCIPQPDESDAKLIEHSEAQIEAVAENYPKIIPILITEEKSSVTKPESETEELNNATDDKPNVSHKEKTKEDAKTEIRTPGKRGRKPKAKQSEITVAVEGVEEDPQILMETNKQIESFTIELEKSSEIEIQQQTFETKETLESVDESSTIQKSAKKSKKVEKIVKVLQIPEIVADSLKSADVQITSIPTKEKATESARKNSELLSKQIEPNKMESSGITEIENVTVEMPKKSEELSKLAEETKIAEKFGYDEENLKITDKSTDYEQNINKTGTNEAKEITEIEEIANTQNSNKKSKKPETKLQASEVVKVTEELVSPEKTSPILETTIVSDEKDFASAQAVELKETSEKIKASKKSRKSENIQKAKEDTSAKSENIEIGEKSQKLKKPGKVVGKDESITDENTKDTPEILEILNKKLEDTSNIELDRTNELKQTETMQRELKETLDKAEKPDLTPKTSEENIKSILNEKAKSADKFESTPRPPPKKRLFKTKSDTELIKNNPDESLSMPVATNQTKETNKELTKKAKKTLKFKDSSTKSKTKIGKNVVKPDEDNASLELNRTPPKRGGKLKQKRSDVDVDASTSSGKKKGNLFMKDIPKAKKSSPKSLEQKKEKLSLKKSEKKKFLENESMADIACKTIEEKTAKKKRQKKLKEAFEAALKEAPPTHTVQNKDNSTEIRTSSEPTIECVVETNINLNNNTPEKHDSPPLYNLPLTPTNFDLSSPKIAEHESHVQHQEVVAPPTIIQPVEEDPDPLKDIEKFIEDGVNLLKRGYKIEDDDSVDEMLCSASSKTVKEDLSNKLVLPKADDNNDQINASQKETNDLPPILSEITSFADTPADTPFATPTASPSKSPVPETTLDDSYTAGVRRSHRIKQNKTPKALVGRGLVRDKERFSLKDDMETKSHYTIDDHRMDLAEVEAKNAKFLKDMEERLSNFLLIKENEYKCERIISKEARKMICDCFLTAEEEGRGELACGEDCLNRLLMIECGPDCNVKERCTNKRFQKFLCSPCRVFRTEKKGFGILADIEILPNEFIMEYVGEVINGDEFENRRIMYSQDKNRHYYFMALRSDAIIDATSKGNISRFINHSCDPNAETQKWTVNGELRIGFFSRKSIMPGEEITFDYQYQRYGREAQRCYCESSNCRGWIGEEPTSDEGEQIDDESDEENLAESLLEDDDEDDSDETEDAEEAQKKLEIAAAEAKLMPITDEDKKDVDDKTNIDEEQKTAPVMDTTIPSDAQKENEEDSKSKFKKLLSKMAEKVAKKKKQKERKQRKQLATNADSTKHVKPRYLEDPDIEDEVQFLSRCGLKNQSDTLRLSRLMVRAKLVQTRLNLLKILRSGDLPCRRLFLDYHGLRLLHGWMSEDGGDLKIRMALLETLETLPIANKTMLTDSKVFQTVRNWCGCGGITSSSADNSLSPSDESSKESSSSSSNNTQPHATQQEVPGELQKLATKLTTAWDSLSEIFRIPKKERIEQMKEHEREADRQYAAIASQEEESRRNTAFPDRYQRDRFGRGPSGSNNGNRFAWTRGGAAGGVKDQRNIPTLNTASNNDPRRRSGNEIATHTAADNTKHLSKEQRREMFAAKVARDEAEKRLAEERREFETKCRFFGLDPKKTRPQNLPFCVNPTTGQWYSAERQPIPTPPTYAHVQVPIKPKSTNPADYQLPPCAMNLTQKWKFAITPQGKIYYYHVQFRVPQWEPPTVEQLYGDSAAGAASDSDYEDADVNDSTDDDDELIKGMDAAKLQAYVEKKIEMRRQHRYGRLVDERPISPRREEDRVYNQIEVRKYKENKEKIRKRKEEIRRKRVEAVKNSTLNMCTLGSLEEPNSSEVLQKMHGRDDENGISNALPIQDYLLSSDEEEMMKAECNNSPLLDKIVQGDKIVDELDALTTKRTLKRSLPPHRDLSASGMSSGASTSSGISVGSLDKHEHKKRKLEKRESSKSGKKSKEHDSKYRKLKEKFRCEIAGIIVHHLKPYRKDSCAIGRIKSNEDFNHLARKLTHFVMIKELKYCESVGQTLVVTESVKNKSREFIKKYMAKYGDEYIKPDNDPDFKDIPFTL